MLNADAQANAEASHDWPRLGDTLEFGSLLLRILELHGWDVDVRPAIGGVIVIACLPGAGTVSQYGETVADVSTEIFKAASSLQGMR